MRSILICINHFDWIRSKLSYFRLREEVGMATNSAEKAVKSIVFKLISNA